MPWRVVIAVIATLAKLRRYGSRYAARASIPDHRRHRPPRTRAARLLLAVLRNAAARPGGEHGSAWSRHRNDPFPLPALRHARGAEDSTGRIATGRRASDARVPVVQLMHLGNRPGPARQAAMVRQRSALPLPWLRWPRRMAHTPAGMPGGMSSTAAAGYA
jgi:hypothetical protein